MGNMGESILIGMLGGMAQEGVKIDDIRQDDNNQTVFYLNFPKGWDYPMGKLDGKPETLAKRYKETWKELGMSNFRIKMKVRDELWTKEKGEQYYNESLPDILKFVHNASVARW